MKQILSILFFIVLTSNLSAQRFYIGVHAGYGFSISSGQATGFDLEETNNQVIYERVQDGLGEGTNVGLRFGYNVSRNLGFELGTSYLFGRTLTTDSKISIPNQEFNNTVSTTVTMLQLSPEVVFKVPSEGKITPYMKFGLLFGLNTLESIEFTRNSENPFQQSTISGVSERSGTVDIGITSTLGANFLVAEKTLLFAELNAINLSYQPKEMTQTAYTVNGTDAFSSLSTFERETVYLDRIEFDPNEPIDSNQPNEALSISVPLSNIRFNIGLRINF